MNIVNKTQHSTPGSVLARLRSKIAAVLHLNDPQRLKTAVSVYINETMYGQPQSVKRHTTANIISYLTNQELTIKNFFKFLAIAKIRNITISLKMTTITNREFEVSETLTLVGGKEQEDKQNDIASI